jgi:hypothetical protein
MRLESVTIDARDPAVVAEFWTKALGWDADVIDDDEIELIGPGKSAAARYPTIEVIRVDDPDAGRDRVHLDLASASVGEQEAWVKRLLWLGATHADVGQDPNSLFTVLADPEGNAFCVLDPRREYGEPGSIASIVLAAHEASALRDVWVAATGWDLIRDEPDFVSLQRPDGAGPLFEIITRPTLEPRTAKNRIHIDVAPGADEDQGEVVARLEALGARRVDIGQAEGCSWVVMADPEDNELCVLSPRD